MAGIVYRGVSALDGNPVVAVLTEGGANRKTGPVGQVWIMPDRPEPPHVSVKDGGDASVCGACPLRPSVQGGCYVLTHQAPAAVHRKVRAGGYGDHPHASPVRGRWRQPVRLGAWGDPAALPQDVVEGIVGDGRWTGFTAQWERFPWLRAFAMASVQSAEDAARAWGLGWRTYRVRPPGAPLLEGEVECPNVTRGVTCQQCGLCDGTRRGERDGVRSISIEAHGTNASRAVSSGAVR